ncbi:MAG: S-layer homology domain-containing protein, partial [Oscillospiraceae bacterium]
MMTFAGAAETKKKTAADLTDLDKVTNKEAVSLLVDLGVIAGRETGAFDPTGTLKRGEFAKMICVTKLGSDKGANLAGGASPLADIKGHWAEGYIKYCYSTKIVAGTSPTTFSPEGELKVVEAAKMLLTALGYDAELSKYNNDPFWSSNIMTDAQVAGLMDGISQISDEKITRDNAAQMIFNALFADQVKPNIDRDQGVAYLVNYANKYTNAANPAAAKNKLGEFVFDLHTVTGVVTANTFGKVTSTAAAKDKTRIDVTAAGGSTINVGLADFALASTAAQLGHQVKFYAKSDKSLISSAVVDSGKTVTYSVSDEHEKFVKDNGLTVDGSTVVITDYAGDSKAFVGYGSAANKIAGDTVLIDVTGDKTIEYAVKSTYVFSNVSDVN